MADLNIPIFEGGTFDFLVGQSKRRFRLHVVAVQRVSDPLFALMTNGMSESNSGEAILDDVEEETFARFATWVYTGKYSAASPIIARPESETSDKGDLSASRRSSLQVEETNTSEVNGDWAVPVEVADEVPPPPEPVYDPQPDPWSGFIGTGERQNDDREPATVGPFELLAENSYDFTDPSLSYLDLLLSHAKVYVFADRQQVQQLRELAAGKVEGVLRRFQCYDTRASDIAALLEYVYGTTADLRNGKDLLRERTCAAVVEHYSDLIGLDCIQKLIWNGGELAIDLSHGMIGCAMATQNPGMTPLYPVSLDSAFRKKKKNKWAQW